jgi:hypothetical protein
VSAAVTVTGDGTEDEDEESENEAIPTMGSSGNELCVACAGGAAAAA